LQVQVNTDNSLVGRQSLVEGVEATVRSKLGRFADRLTRVEVHLGDTNSASRGGVDKRCMVEARPNGLQPVSVTDEAAEVQQALAGALAKMTAALDTTFGKAGHR
jgi:hypothetical protein